MECYEVLYTHKLQQYLPLAVLKHVLILVFLFNMICLLQQYLPLAVLKPLGWPARVNNFAALLQQYLPLAVLKHIIKTKLFRRCDVATVLTACGIET